MLYLVFLFINMLFDSPSDGATTHQTFWEDHGGQPQELGAALCGQ